MKCNMYSLRMKLSFLLVKLATKIYPDSPVVREFHMKAMMDELIYGGSITRIDPKEIYKENEDGTE